MKGGILVNVWFVIYPWFRCLCSAGGIVEVYGTALIIWVEGYFVVMGIQPSVGIDTGTVCASIGWGLT
jgi:hypothetical protein